MLNFIQNVFKDKIYTRNVCGDYQNPNNVILVLEDGHIIEQGAHKDLIEKNGRYAYLFYLQASKYE